MEQDRNEQGQSLWANLPFAQPPTPQQTSRKRTFMLFNLLLLVITGTVLLEVYQIFMVQPEKIFFQKVQIWKDQHISQPSTTPDNDGKIRLSRKIPELIQLGIDGKSLPGSSTEIDLAHGRDLSNLTSPSTSLGRNEKRTMKESRHRPNLPAVNDWGKGGQVTSNRIIKDNIQMIQVCHERALRQDPSLIAGKVTVKIMIGRSGEVQQTQIIENTFYDRSIESCIQSQLLRIKFPPLDRPDSIIFPFFFSKRLAQ
jgi:hypothetical protein